LTKNCITQARNSFWYKIHDLIFVHNTEMVVWQQCDNTPPLVCTTIQYNCTRLGYTKRTAGEHTIAGIKLLVSERITILQQLNATG
jgi:hypothetical protein